MSLEKIMHDKLVEISNSRHREFYQIPQSLWISSGTAATQIKLPEGTFVGFPKSSNVSREYQSPEEIIWKQAFDKFEAEEKRRKQRDAETKAFSAELSKSVQEASDTKWGMPHQIPYGTSASWNLGDTHTVPTWWTPHCDHEFVDTGTLKSYCKKCNADAVWCSKELKFVLK